MWTGTTNTFDGNSPMKAIKGLVKVVIDALEKRTSSAGSLERLEHRSPRETANVRA